MAAAKRRGKRPALPGTPPAENPQAENPQAAPDIAAMIRVDLAGELGALRIYEGQLAVLSQAADKENLAAVQRMAAQEKRHFETFSEMVKERGVRPTALEPLWHVAGYALGAASALMGERAAMACTVAVEDAIDAHYAGQIDALSKRPAENKLQKTIMRFREDELEHRDEALKRGAEEAPFYEALSAAIRFGCRAAIRLSERL